MTLQGFIRQFGNYHPDTDIYAFDTTQTSLLSSLAFIGKFLGCLFAGPAIERFGHRNIFFGLSAISFIGIISEFRLEHLKLLSHSRLTLGVLLVEITAADSAAATGRFAQFIVGRIIVYISVGLVEVGVT